MAYVLDPAASGASGAAAAVAAIPHSHAIAMLEAERQEMIAMSAAARTFSVVAQPKVASPVTSSSPPPGNSSPAPVSSPSPLLTLPDVAGVKSLALNLMAGFGFSPSGQFQCLDELWTRESNWMVDAENASGAYGIPQALPAVKMATAGLDWQTDPSTQIRWGLEYIQEVYGTPCSAWAFELANGYY